MTTEKLDVLHGTLDLLVLQVAAAGPVHGYAIAKRLRQISHDVLQITQGSLYPALHRLEKRRWLRSEWRAAESGREAKFYTLTATGRRQLEVERVSWTRLSEAVALVLRAARDAPHTAK